MDHNNSAYVKDRYPIQVKKPVFQSMRKFMTQLIEDGFHEEFKMYLFKSFRTNYPRHKIYSIFIGAKECTFCDEVYDTIDFKHLTDIELKTIIEEGLWSAGPRAFHNRIDKIVKRLKANEEEEVAEKAEFRRLRAEKGVAEYRSTTFQEYLRLFSVLKVQAEGMTPEEEHFFIQITEGDIPTLVNQLDRVIDPKAYSTQASKLETLLQGIVQEFQSLSDKITSREAEAMSTELSAIEAVMDARLKERAFNDSLTQPDPLQE